MNRYTSTKIIFFIFVLSIFIIPVSANYTIDFSDYSYNFSGHTATWIEFDKFYGRTDTLNSGEKATMGLDYTGLYLAANGQQYLQIDILGFLPNDSMVYGVEMYLFDTDLSGIEGYIQACGNGGQYYFNTTKNNSAVTWDFADENISQCQGSYGTNGDFQITVNDGNDWAKIDHFKIITDYEESPIPANTINFYPDLEKTNSTNIYVNSSALIGAYINLTVTIQTESCQINPITFLYENCVPHYDLISIMHNSWFHDEVDMSENITGFLEAGNNTDSFLGSYLDLGSYQLLYNILFYNVTLHNVTGEILATDSLQFSPYFVEMVEQNESNITIPNWTEPPDIDDLNVSWDLPDGQNSTNTTINTSNLDGYSSFINETSAGLNSSLGQIDNISTGLFSGINSSIQTIKSGLNSQNNTKSVQIVCSYSCLFNSIPMQIQLVIVLDLLLTCFLIIMRH